MLLSKIEEKYIVNVNDGQTIGSIVDLDIEPNSGQIFAIYIQQDGGVMNVFKKRNLIKITWEQIVKIGVDTILVNYPVKNIL
ncbi:MAG: hypothetical protein K0Q49_6 [Haloplasmataceae bacterium]|jgi:YlmC/YmxH family sporulation protein|nr:hypothetical protein [Haloplasmataceae bacterium]